MQSRGQQVSGSDFPVQSCTHIPSILRICVQIRGGADGDDTNDDGDRNCNGDGDGDGIGFCDNAYSIRSTKTSRLATSMSASKLLLT